MTKKFINMDTDSEGKTWIEYEENGEYKKVYFSSKELAEEFYQSLIS